MTHLHKYFILLVFLVPWKLFSQTDLKKNEFLLKGKVIDINTKKPISRAHIKIISTDSLDSEFQSDTNGFFKKKLEYSSSYTLMVSAPGYLNAKGREGGYHGGSNREHLYELEKLENCSGLIPLMTYNFNEVNEPFEPTKPDFNVLDYLSQILQNNPTLHIELLGFRDKEEANTTSLKRAENAVLYLTKKGISPNRVSPIDGGVNRTLTEKKRESEINSTEISHNRLLLIKIIEN